MQRVAFGEKFSATWIGEIESRTDGTANVEFREDFTTESGVMISYIEIGNDKNKLDGSAVCRGGACFSAPLGKFAKLNLMEVIF